MRNGSTKKKKGGKRLLLTKPPFRIVSIIVWKSDSPVSTVVEFLKLDFLLVKMRSMHLGLSDLEHVGDLIKLHKSYQSMKLLIVSLVTKQLKSRNCRKFS